MPKKRQTRKKVEKKKKIRSSKEIKQHERRNKVRGVWKTYERVWAEDGVVKIQDKDTGEITHLAPRDAVLRAQAINRMLGSKKIPWEQREKALSFVSRVLEIIRTAMAQNETPANQNEQVVSNVLAGKTAEGDEIKPITDPEEMMKYLHFKFPMMSEKEIQEVFTSDASMKDKIGVMQTINSDRLVAVVREHKQQTGQ